MAIVRRWARSLLILYIHSRWRDAPLKREISPAPASWCAGSAIRRLAEGAQGRILLIGHGPRRTAKPVERLPDQLLEMTVPQLLCGCSITTLQ
jgi:hypothetical protein